MTTKQYLAALKKLGLQPQAKATAEALGLSVRQLARLAAGAPISGTLARLLDVLRAHHPVSPPQP
jgi:hypothetical protein